MKDCFGSNSDLHQALQASLGEHKRKCPANDTGQKRHQFEGGRSVVPPGEPETCKCYRNSSCQTWATAVHCADLFGMRKRCATNTSTARRSCALRSFVFLARSAFGAILVRARCFKFRVWVRFHHGFTYFLRPFSVTQYIAPRLPVHCLSEAQSQSPEASFSSAR
jgi:hypothetical protein